MAGTYYKYAEQSADSYINWAEIGKNMTDMLAQEKKIREDKRAALDESSRQYGEQLSEPPQGDSKSLNQYSLEFASQAQQNRLLQDRLFKSGRLKQKDYLVNRQNLEDGTKNLYGVLKEYNAEFKDKMERANSQDPSKKSQYAEQWLMENIEGFANFNTSAAYINPTDGTISIAMKEKKMVNGKEVYVMSDNPDKFASIASLRNRLKNKYDYYDTPKQIGAMVDGWGSEINSFVQSKNSLGATGTIAEALDITKRENLPTDPVKLKLAFTEAQKKGFKGTQEQWVSSQNNLKQVAMGFEQAETKMLDSQLANSWNVSSVLTNTLTAAPNGLPYKFTWNPKERDANPNLILMKEGPNGPELDFTGKVGEEQYNQARERLRLEARMQYDKKVELKVTPQTESRYAPEYVYKSKREDKILQDEAGALAEQVANIVTGNPNKIDEALKYFRTQQINVVRNPQGKPPGLYITGKDGNTVPFGFDKDGKPADPLALSKSLIAAGGGLNPNKIEEQLIIKQLPKYLGKSIETTTGGTGIELDVNKEFKNKISDIVKPILFTNKKNDEAVPKLRDYFKSIPSISVTPNNGALGVSNFIDITYTPPGGGEPISIKLNSNESGKKAQNNSETLFKFLNELPEQEKSKFLGIKEPAQQAAQPAQNAKTTIGGGNVR
jgi:hypothetical protein